MKTIVPFLAAGAMLAACQTTETGGNLQDDRLPSAEVTAFQQVDRRLGYDDARIAYDAQNCAVYIATGPDGRPYSERLRTASGEAICPG